MSQKYCMTTVQPNTVILTYSMNRINTCVYLEVCHLHSFTQRLHEHADGNCDIYMVPARQEFTSKPVIYRWRLVKVLPAKILPHLVRTPRHVSLYILGIDVKIPNMTHSRTDISLHCNSAILELDC